MVLVRSASIWQKASLHKGGAASAALRPRPRGVCSIDEFRFCILCFSVQSTPQASCLPSHVWERCLYSASSRRPCIRCACRMPIRVFRTLLPLALRAALQVTYTTVLAVRSGQSAPAILTFASALRLPPPTSNNHHHQHPCQKAFPADRLARPTRALPAVLCLAICCAPVPPSK